MFTCGDCYAVCEGHDKHPEATACDEFDGAEDAGAPEPLDATVELVKALMRKIDQLDQAHYELERRFNTVVAAVVRAAGAEEER